MEIKDLYSWLKDIEEEMGKGLSLLAREHALVVAYLIRELIAEKKKNAERPRPVAPRTPYMDD
jgi:hypothetical protein